MFAFRNPNGKTPKDMFPMLFEDEEDLPRGSQLTDEDRAELQALIDNANQKGETL